VGGITREPEGGESNKKEEHHAVDLTKQYNRGETNVNLIRQENKSYT